MDYKAFGCYFSLLFAQWNKGTIPKDTKKMASLCRGVPVDEFVNEIWPQLAPCYQQDTDPDRLFQPRLREEYEIAFQEWKKTSEAGKKGSGIREENKKSNNGHKPKIKSPIQNTQDEDTTL